MTMSKGEVSNFRPVRRINLSLPIVQTDSYEIYDGAPHISFRQFPNGRPLTRQKPLIDVQKKTNASRSSNRAKPINAPVLINLVVDIPTAPTDSSSNVVDSISHALINSGYSEQTLRAVPKMFKHSKRTGLKDDTDQSQSSFGDRLVYESVESFDDLNIHKPRTTMWQNAHHPQLTSYKVFQTRRVSKRPSDPIATGLKYSPLTNTFETRSKELLVAENEHLQARIEQLTKTHYPSIQQLRHSHPCPELLSNRMHLHREEKRDFVPLLTRLPEHS